MDYFERLQAYNIMENIKDIPPELRPLALTFLMTNKNSSGFLTNLLVALTKHGVPFTELLPCLMDILEVMITKDDEDGEDDVAGQRD